MTTELEKQFFDTFGIEPEIYQTPGRDETPDGELASWYVEKIYPTITAEKLLELICVLNKHYADNFQVATLLVGDNIEKVRECILNSCIEEDKFIKQAVRKLFEEGNL